MSLLDLPQVRKIATGIFYFIILLDAKCKVGEGGLQCYNRELPNKQNCNQSESDEDAKSLFEQLQVISLTTKQNTPECFLLHYFSFSSSMSNHLLAGMKKMSLDHKTYHLIDPLTKDALREVINVVHGIGWDCHAPVSPLQ